jgi:hypothetical protein
MPGQTRITGPIPIVSCKKTTVTTSGSGAAATVSENITGEILKIAYDKGTVNAGTTCVTTITLTTEQIDSKDVNAAAKAVTYPVVALNGASAGDNRWGHYAVDGSLTFTVTGGALSKTFYVYVYYR